ncbi:MAG: ATP-binding protein [Pseudomonadota bacterium]
MTSKSYKTIDDIKSIVSNKIPEGVTLEYKTSDILAKGKSDTICKTVSAFANSAGGQFVIGIESKDDEPVGLDGGFSGDSKRDWFYQIIDAHTFPAVESVDILEIKEASSFYYVITVPPSPQAPHQSGDNKYYKRHGSHSLPMEHYEVEDVRNRPREKLAPLRIDLMARNGIGFLRLRNDHASASAANIKCVVSSNVEFERDGIESLASRGLRDLRAQLERFFILDGIGLMLEKDAEAEIHVETSYEFLGTQLNDSITFYLGDFSDSAVVNTISEDALGHINEGIKDVSKELQNLVRSMESLGRITDGTGLRLSHRTLMALKDQDQLLDPFEFDWEGYKIILDLSTSDAIDLNHIFGTISPPKKKREDYENLSSELRKKFETRFKVDFGEA